MSAEVLLRAAAGEGGSVSAGPLGLLVLVLMGIATVLLIRNMNSRLRKLPRSFPEPPPAETSPEDRPRG